MIDPHTKFRIEKEGMYDDKRIDDMYVKFDGEIIPAAYIYPYENKEKILELLEELKTAKKIFDDIQNRIFYKDLSKLR